MNETTDLAALQAHLETLRLGLAHEVRTPLAVMRAKAELLGRAGTLNADQQALVQELLSAADRAEGLLKGLLEGTHGAVGATNVQL